MTPIAARRTLLALVLALALPGLVSTRPAPASRPAETVRLLVKFRADTSSTTAAQALATGNARQLRTIRGLGVHVVRVPSASLGQAVKALKGSPRVAYVERDAVLKPQEVLPNDPYFPQQYALEGGAWGWYQTHTTQGWGITEGNPSVVIAILDTGLKTAGLSDFDGQVMTGWNVLSNSSNTTSQAGNHGTYVAGAAGLALGNGIGSAGFCPGCRIMPVQVGTDSGAYLSDLATGLTWAADHGARVANMSWAGTSTSSTLQSAINYAHSKGLVLTAAAGNSNCDCKTYPAAYPGLLAVGGTDNTGNKAGDSNYGTWVTLAAPEGNLTAWPMINGAPGYAPVGGTSLAAPVVAGIAGLLLSYNGSLTNTQVEQALEASAAPAPFTVQYGRVDAFAALNYLGATDPQPATAPVQTSPAQIYYELNGASSIAALTTAPQPGQVLVRGVGGWTGSAGLAVAGLQWQRCDGGGLNCTALTSASTYTVQSADVGYTLKLVFSVKNALGSVSRAVLTPLVGGGTAPVSPPPTNTSPPTISGTAQDGKTLAGSTGSWSGSPTAYAYQWQRCDSAGSGCAAITGATGSSYLVQTADVGSTLRVAVSASNSAGSGATVSAATAVVASAPAAPPPTTTVTFSGSLNAKSPSRSYSFKVGAGRAVARLSFSKCSSLALALSNGARTSGPSVVVLDQTLAAGTYAYTISGGRCSFTLTVTAPSP